MAFWAQASSAAQPSRPSSGPAPALTYLLSPGTPSLIGFANLVRLRVDVPAAAAALAAAAEDTDDEATAAQHAQDAACAIGRLHHIIRGIEQNADDVRQTSVLELLQDKQLQLLCSKSVVAKVYKSLLPHQTALGYAMAPAKACLSQKPVAAWDLQESLQTAVIKTLTGCSSGTPTTTHASTPGVQPTGSAGASAAAGGHQGWMCLSRHKLMGCDLLAASPGQVCTTHFVNLEVKFDAGNKGVLLIVTEAGSVKFRMFSPSHALQQDPNTLRAPLTPSDTDTTLLEDRSKLAAAARQLEGRAVKLLPDERLVFIKSLTAAPKDPTTLQHMSDYWLGCFGLLLPPSFPFLIGVATHPEAEAAQMQVPSCCVLTNLGLSTLPGSRPGGACHTAAVSRLVSDVQASAAAYSFWGNKLTAQVSSDATPGAGHSQATLQLSQPCKDAAAAAAPAHLKAYGLQTQWTPAAELSKLQVQASKQQQRQPLLELTAAEVQLLGLVESDMLTSSMGCDATMQPGSSRQQQQLFGQKGGSSSSSTAGQERFLGLRAFLAQREKEQQDQQQQIGGGSGRVGGTAASIGPSRLLSSARGLASGSSTAAAAAAAGPSGGPAAAAAGARLAPVAGGGPPAAPRFGCRNLGTSKPPAKAPAAAAAGGKKPGAAAAKPLPGASLFAALQAQQLESDGPTAAAGAAGGGSGAASAAVGGKPLAAAAIAAPALLKRPGVGEAAAKPAKKAKTAAAAGPGAAATAAAKPKPPKKPKAPAAAAAAPAGAIPAAAAAAAGGDVPAAVESVPTAGAAGEGIPTASQPAAAATAGDQQQQRKRTKATDLDLAVVTAKVQAAFAASGGSVLKGVSVPEMQCYLRAQGVKGGSAKRADVEARLLAVLSGGTAVAAS